MQKQKFWIAIVIFGLLTLTSPLAQAATTQLTQVQITTDNRNTHIALHLTNSINYHIFTLLNPNRLVIDLPDTRLATSLHNLNLSHTPILRVREGHPKPGLLRLVLDLDRFLSPSEISLDRSTQNGEQLVLNLPVENNQIANNPVINTPAKNNSAISNPPKPTQALQKTQQWAQENLADTLTTPTPVQLKPVATTSPNKTTPLLSTSQTAATAKIFHSTPPNARQAAPSQKIIAPPLVLTPKSITAPVPTAKISKTTPTLALPRKGGGDQVVAASTPQQDHSIAPHRPSRPIVVVIDPGHGGKDPGTIGPNGVREKNVVLAISRDLYQILQKDPDFRPALTRRGDYFISLRGRLAIARQDKGDMFIAIHADAYREPGATGAAIFALSPHGASSEAARWLAEKENYSELGGVTLNDKSDVLRSVLIDLSQTATISSSIQLGTMLLPQLASICRLHYTRVEQAPFMVLKSPDIPSLLVETGFLSNPIEERRLSDPAYQQKVAQALYTGIKNYFWNNPPPGTLLADRRVSAR
jgi:N-acetylmuramoyl-L-alanine amidase